MKKNYNYAFVFYDISEKRVQKVFKICKKYLIHYQYSVFRGEITPSNIIKMQNEFKKVINPKNDFISIILMQGDYVFEEKIIGTSKKDTEDIFL
ncbi:MAG: CRISPR-associated endonuclease Cas2 [bacterium]